jgi:hypothetical protein
VHEGTRRRSQEVWRCLKRLLYALAERSMRDKYESVGIDTPALVPRVRLYWPAG